MKLQTAKLVGIALDWAVAKCEGIDTKNYSGALTICYDGDWWQPSTDWAQAGPIIELEIASLRLSNNLGWAACRPYNFEEDKPEQYVYGPTPLIAAMRCYVISQFGEEIDVPDEIINTEQH